MSLRAVVMFVFVSLAFTRAVAARQETSRGHVEGTVWHSESREPLERAEVSLQRIAVAAANTGVSASSNMPQQIPPVITGRDGRFVFSELDPGPYQLRVVKNGYTAQVHGQNAAGQGAIISLTAGQHVSDIRFHMTPAGIVTGRVRQQDGEPIVGAHVSLLRITFSDNGRRALRGVAQATTDDRGEYRIVWAPAGRYLVRVEATAPAAINAPRQNAFNTPAFPATYYPSTLEPASAVSVELRPGSELTAIDLSVTQPETYRIRGRLIDPSTGQPPRGAGFFIATRPEAGSSWNVGVDSSKAASSYDSRNGTFEIRNVLPGTYWIRATVSASPERAASTMAALNGPARGSINPAELASIMAVAGTAQEAVSVVSADLEDVILTLAKGVSVPIRFILEGAELSSVRGNDAGRVVLKPIEAGAPNAVQRKPFTPEGTASLENIPVGEYRVQVVTPLPDAYLKEVRFEGRDLLRDPWQVTSQTSGTLDIVLSTKAAQITGKLASLPQQQSSGVQVVLIPDQRDRSELYKTATSDSDGNFSMRGITPGSYKLFAWDAIEPNAWHDGKILSKYEPSGKAIRIQESGKDVVELTVIRDPE